MKKLLLFITATLFVAVAINAQHAGLFPGKDTNLPAPDVNATIIQNVHSGAKDAVYNPPDSPDTATWSFNTYTELGWTDIVVSETDIIGVVTVDYTWSTDRYWAGSFHLQSPAGTSVVFASSEISGTYSVSMTDFFGESMNGTWTLWIEDTHGYGRYQATDISVTFHTQLTHDLGTTGITPVYIASGGSNVPWVEIYNFGSTGETTYTVNLNDGDTYNETVNVTTSIASNTSTLIDFPEWSPVDGVYSLTTTVTLSDDENSANDIFVCTSYIGTGVGIYSTNTAYSHQIVGPYSNQITELPLETGVVNPVTGSGTEAYLCGEYINGAIYAIAWTTNNVYIVLAEGNDVQVGTMTGIASEYIVTGLAYDHINDVIYASACNYNIHNCYFYIVDDSWKCTLVNDIGYNLFVGLTFDKNGILYGFDTTVESFWSIDQDTGIPTLIGHSGYNLSEGGDLSCDTVNNIIYAVIWDHVNEKNRFGTFDATAGAFTNINPDLTGFQEMCAIVSGEPTMAPITFTVDNNANTSYTGFALKGSWDAYGNYDVNWNGDAEHTDFYDDGTHGDAVAGDDIWSVLVYLVPDGGTNTWEWGVNDQDGNWIDGNFQFTVPDVNAQTMSYTTLNVNSASCENISIYPNPSKGAFTVSVMKNYNLEVFDITGRMIDTKILTGNSTVEINTAGIYFFRFSDEEGSVTQRVIVQ